MSTETAVVFLFTLKMILSIQLSDHDVEGILNEDYGGVKGPQYIELVHYADYFMQLFQQYSFIIVINMFNMINALRIARTIHWTMLIIERTLKVLITFFMMLTPIQIGFVFTSIAGAGPYDANYATFVGSLKMQVITMMGQQDSVKLYLANPLFTIIWTMIFIIFFAYLQASAVVVAFEDGFDVTVQ